ncbi:MAG: histidine phosphatase family protein [Nonlabens sp.]|uniref:SixA phosphatase family protein n=1 Tax=Nonlabens sp. TaxID=1888209 RepID=UPI00321B1E02
MKRLIVIRHGKSSWDLNVRDHDRVLAQRGVDDGHLIGEALKELHINPDIIWSSTAARALQTATLVSEYLDYNLTKLKLKRTLYTFDSEELLNVISSCDDSLNSLIIFSHNHGITDLVNKMGNTRFDNVPTTGVVAIEFDTDSWSSLNRGVTKFHLFPKQIK